VWGRLTLVAVAAACALAPAAAHAAAPVEPYRTNDFGGFHDVLPPGTNGLANATGIAAFLGPTHARPAHNDDQLGMYRDLMYAAPGLQAADLGKYYKDSSFGLAPGDAGRTYSPGGRDDVTVVRDSSFGVPHVYATTRAGAMFALGYVTAEDRLFFIDILRHLGRAQLTSFAGGAPGNRAFDEAQWQTAPYTEQDLQRQIDLGLQRFGADGQMVHDDSANFVDGINRYISEAKLDPTKMPGEYAAINQPLGPDPWKLTDLIAEASLVGGIFGQGGGQEIESMRLLGRFQARFGRARGARLWRQIVSIDDPEAPTTVRGHRFVYQTGIRRVARGSAAVNHGGPLVATPVVESGADAGTSATTAAARARSGAAGLLALPRSNSNALVISARESASGHPLAVFGPQVAYFAPEILMEQDVHAPGIDARGAAFPGVNLYVELGRGRDYAWSATSAGQDIIDTFAVDLCNPDGSAATPTSDHYMFRGQCLPIEVLRRENSWSPNLADSTPAGSQTLRAERTKLGIVTARGTVGGRPVAFTKLRSTYMHEIESAGGFADFNDPDKIKGPQDFQRAAYKIGYTFNWFYVDDKHTAYFNSGNNPVRAPNVDPLLPTNARFEWRDFNPDDNTAAYTPFAQHPRAIDQDWMTSWNNRQAPGYAGALTNVFGPVYRSQMLDEGIVPRLRGGRKMTLPELVDAMENAATTDLRGDRALPYALDVLSARRAPAPRHRRGRLLAPLDPEVAAAVAKLRAWQRSGAHRIDRNRDGTYDDSDAIAIMDAWWPRWLHAEFEPTMGQPLFDELQRTVEFDNAPNNHGDHLGSAYQDGWYGYANKDLRTMLRRRVLGRYARAFCGGGSFVRCRQALADSLREALHVDRKTLYHDPGGFCDDGDQTCFDAIRFRPLGAITQPLTPWQNRPTYQQADEIQGHR
jgi:acyl-homoserine lactone acylase PvdQ